MANQLQLLKSLRAEAESKQFRLETLQAVANSKTNKLLDETIKRDEIELADLQLELAKLTVEVTNIICASLNKPQMIEVMLAREVEGLKFSAIARRIKRSLRRTRDIYEQGLQMLTSANQ